MMLRDPQLVFLDEPTAHMDQHTEARVIAALQAWLPGRTLLLATDGVEDPWYPLARHAPALLASLAGEAATVPEGLLLTGTAAPLREADGAGDALLHWLAFEKRGENDDRTLAVVRSPGAAG